MDARGPLCVGIDPHPGLLAAWGLPDDPGGLERFSGTVVEALADRVAVLKPQSAFFERFGSRGVAVLERTVADARAAGALVVTDAKRGDIGSTMAAYAAAYLDPAAPLFSDALTVSPYLGFGSLRPASSWPARNGCGLFVLALTSNPEGAEVQHAWQADGASVAAAVLRPPREGERRRRALGSFGAVVGATLGGTLRGSGWRGPAVNGPLLAPGIGAQGATRQDLPQVFGGALRTCCRASAGACCGRARGRGTAPRGGSGGRRAGHGAALTGMTSAVGFGGRLWGNVLVERSLTRTFPQFSLTHAALVGLVSVGSGVNRRVARCPAGAGQLGSSPIHSDSSTSEVTKAWLFRPLPLNSAQPRSRRPPRLAGSAPRSRTGSSTPARPCTR